MILLAALHIYGPPHHEIVALYELNDGSGNYMIDTTNEKALNCANRLAAWTVFQRIVNKEIDAHAPA